MSDIMKPTGPDPRDTAPTIEDTSMDFERIHLRLPKRDAEALRKLARGRDQTLSATVRFLLRSHLRGR